MYAPVLLYMDLIHIHVCMLNDLKCTISILYLCIKLIKQQEQLKFIFFLAYMYKKENQTFYVHVKTT